MKKAILVMATLALVSACGGSEARSGGTLTVAPSEPTTTFTPSPPVTGSAPTTTAGSPTSTTTTSSTSTSTTVPGAGRESTVAVYFLDGSSRAVPVERVVEGSAVARGALEALISGPTTSEQSAGLSTAFPSDSLVLGLTIGDGTAVVDMSLEFESGGGATSVLGRLAQLVYTLTGFDSVERVRLLIEGEQVEHFSGEGVMVDEALTRADFSEVFPITSERPASSAPTWEQEDLDAVAPGAAHRVVLVAADDYLNVRERPGTEGEIVGRVRPGATVRASGGSTAVGTSTWLEIRTPAGAGWVNGYYLTPVRAEDSFESAAVELLGDLSERFASGADFTGLVSNKGLWVAHHAPPIRFDHAELAGILDDDTTYRWGSNALEPDSPEIRPRTFAEAVAERFVDAYDDPDRDVLVGEAVEGPNGRPPEFALPTELSGFPFVTVFDPGDEKQYEGLDWTTWIVSFSSEGGAERVVGLTLDEWAP